MATISNKISVKGKKRSRVAFANHKYPGPEIKKTNAYFDPDASGNNLYSSLIWVPFQTNIPSGRSDYVAAYHTRMFRVPTQDTKSTGRVGDSIRIRNIVLKGYCNVHTSLMTACRIKLYFVRWMNDPTLEVEKLWINTEGITSSDSVSDQIKHMKHNYYKSVLNSDIISKEKTVQKILEFQISPFHDTYRGTTMNGTLGDGVWAGHAVPATLDVTAYSIPIYKNLKVNETFSCKWYTEGGTNRFYDHYGIVMQCDSPVAASGTFTPGQSVPNFSALAGAQPFELNFFTLIYYTDA
jgi:hypothetical protein